MIITEEFGVVRVILSDDPRIPPQSDRRRCASRITAPVVRQAVEAAGFEFQDDPDGSYICSREPHDVATFHVSHGVLRCTVWGGE